MGTAMMGDQVKGQGATKIGAVAAGGCDIILSNTAQNRTALISPGQSLLNNTEILCISG